MSILKLTSDTLVGTPATGNIEYNGQFFGTDSNNSRAQMQRIVSGTTVNASGTSVDFTGIPSWAKKITVMFSGVSTNGTSALQVQLGTSSGVTTSGYTATATIAQSTVTTASYTTGFGINTTGAAVTRDGHVVFTLLTGNTWIGSGLLMGTNAAAMVSLAGSIGLAATLDRVRITSLNGTDTFDAGTINIIYEG